MQPDAVPVPSHSKKNVPDDFRKVNGWGADLDPKNRPAVPKEHMPPRFVQPHWTIPTQQKETIPVLISTERPTITPVFGTSVPPAGVSGLMRRFAFKYSESDLRHWLMLLAADRVNVVEGVVEDLVHGHVPNIFKEMGWGAELRYRPVRGVFKIAVTIGGLGLAIYKLFKREPKRTFFQRLVER